MGNCFGRPSTGKANNFDGPGRTLGNAPAPAPASAKVPAVVNSPGRRLGSNSGEATVDGNSPKTAAARAAEERMKATQNKAGKLGKQLNAQKSKTQAQTLAEASQQNQAARDADAINETRIYE